MEGTVMILNWINKFLHEGVRGLKTMVLIIRFCINKISVTLGQLLQQMAPYAILERTQSNTLLGDPN